MPIINHACLKTTKTGASSTTISTMSCFKYDMRISIATIPNTKDWAKEKKNLFCLPHYTILCPMLNHKTLKNLHPWYTYPYKHHICRFNLCNTQLQKQKRAQNEKSSGEIMAQLILHLPAQIVMFTHMLQLCSSLIYQASDLQCISPKCSYGLQLLPELSSKII